MCIRDRVETASKRKPRLTKYVSGKTIDNQKFSMTGTVVGPKAGPLANAAVRFFLERYTSGVGRRAKPVAETTTNSQGKFSIRFENKDGISADTVIAIASHRDYVLDWVGTYREICRRKCDFNLVQQHDRYEVRLLT